MLLPKDIQRHSGRVPYVNLPYSFQLIHWSGLFFQAKHKSVSVIGGPNNFKSYRARRQILNSCASGFITLPLGVLGRFCELLNSAMVKKFNNTFSSASKKTYGLVRMKQLMVLSIQRIANPKRTVFALNRLERQHCKVCCYVTNDLPKLGDDELVLKTFSLPLLEALRKTLDLNFPEFCFKEAFEPSLSMYCNSSQYNIFIAIPAGSDTVFASASQSIISQSSLHDNNVSIGQDCILPHRG